MAPPAPSSGSAIDTAAPDSLFPWPTLAINVVGAFVLGVLPALAVVRRSRRVALALGPGVLGGFTTVSAWAGQVRELADDGHAGLAGLCLLLTLAAGLAAAALGQHLAHRAEPRRRMSTPRRSSPPLRSSEQRRGTPT